MTVLTREWQMKCFDGVRVAWAGGRRDFLVQGCPGSGKTRLALAVAAEALRSDQCGILIVVTPTAHLRRQWATEATKMGLSLRRAANDSLADGLPSDCVGYISTYASVASWPELHSMLCNTRSAFVVFDEIHHAGIGRGWGESLKAAFEDATFRLALSGTPFRGDNSPIPFVTYDAQGISAPDHLYGYGDAVRDSVCRRICFPSWNGDVEWAYGGETRAASFDEDLDDVGQSHRLRTSLTPKGHLLGDMLEHAHARLRAMRASEHGDAGGLVLADDQVHARSIAEVMRTRFGIDPVVAVSDDSEASHKIKAFEKGSSPWLVAVRMVSEGVDIPRLRIGVYATCTVAQLFFTQVVGRFVRWQNHLKEQTAYLYFPADKRLLEMACAIHEQAKIGLQEKERREREMADEERQKQLFVPISADGREGDHIFGGTNYSPEEIAKARRIQDAVDVARPLPESLIAAIGRTWTLPFTESIEAGEEPIDRDTVEERLKKEIQNLVGKIAHRTYGHGNGGHDKVHAELNSGVGTRLKAKTVGYYEKKRDLAKRWLARLTNEEVV